MISSRVTARGGAGRSRGDSQRPAAAEARATSASASHGRGRPPRHGGARRLWHDGRGVAGRRVAEGDARFPDVPQAELGVALEAAAEQLSYRVGRAGRQRAPIRLRLQHGRERVAHRLAFEEPAAGQHLEQQDAEGPDVRALVHGAAARLLGRHVGGRAEDQPRGGAGVRERRRLREVGRRGRPGVRARPRLRQAEVEHLHRAVRRQLDVRRLQVAVHDAFLVRLLESLRHLLRDPARLVERDRAALESRGEVLPLHQLHHQHVGLRAVRERRARRSRRGGRCRGG